LQKNIDIVAKSMYSISPFDVQELRNNSKHGFDEVLYVDSRDDTSHTKSIQHSRDGPIKKTDVDFLSYNEANCAVYQVYPIREKPKKILRLNLSERMRTKAKKNMMDRRKQREINKHIMMTYLEQGINPYLESSSFQVYTERCRLPSLKDKHSESFGSHGLQMPFQGSGGEFTTLQFHGDTTKMNKTLHWNQQRSVSGREKVQSNLGQNEYIRSNRFQEDSRTIVSGHRIRYDPSFYYCGARDGSSYNSWRNKTAEKRMRDEKKAALVKTLKSKIKAVNKEGKC